MLQSNVVFQTVRPQQSLPPGYRILSNGETVEPQDLIYSGSWKPTPVYSCRPINGTTFARPVVRTVDNDYYAK
jgi:hypothetical protein